MAELCSNICLRGGIDAQCEGGMGGVKMVAMTNWADNLFTTYQIDEYYPISYVTADTNGGTCGSTSDWFKFTFRKNTASMTSTLNIDEGNGSNYVTTDLVLQFNKMSKTTLGTAKYEQFVELCSTPLAIVVQDNNNNYWALGVDEPVTASAGEGVTGTNRTDSNHYSITLSDISKAMPYPCRNGAVVMNAAVY